MTTTTMVGQWFPPPCLLLRVETRGVDWNDATEKKTAHANHVESIVRLLPVRMGLLLLAGGER
jgi:hypothetical protein